MGRSIRLFGFLSLILIFAGASQAQENTGPATSAPDASTTLVSPDLARPQGANSVDAAPVVGAPASVSPAAASASPVVAAPAATQRLIGQQSADPVAQPSAGVEDPAASGTATAGPVSTGVAPVSADETAVRAANVEAGAAPEDTASAASAAHGIHDLSPYGMYMAADWVVKAVMISLAVASVLTWTVWLAKSLHLFGARGRAKRGLRAVVKARTLDEVMDQLGQRGGVVATMVRAAKREVTMSDAAIDQAGGSGVKERVASALGRIEAAAGRNMSKGTGVLASIGSTAPFVGLFGTVWGIMNSFIGIAETQTTNLAVVAPGIAEALLATAIGLVAAIPAVIFYNQFARSVTGYRQLIADAGAGIERLVSRDLDFRKNGQRHQRDTAPVAAE
ncbi:tonB-system energizer ExbB [Peteryoungia desertarenae]|uniref:Biopolymer transport protein ExbB n=2 Tax=Peteryoungia desertarenae TaxID=1813451 RepID=A0ABX6QSN4_9HYPH|nr:tonB-system energizer ExbB [Peteryoungia desertarenae]